jgi:hypothetical protein
MTMTAMQPAPSQQQPQRRWRRVARYAAMILLIGLLAGELFSRFYLGLGDPPVTITHPTIEYLFAPNQHVHRFGNRIEINSYSMRSAEFPQKKEDSRELRVLVLGDSIINGGALTDQDELATELLRRDLEERLDRPVVVGNVSAGSWGPPNLLAYVKEFGTFDADIAVLVFNGPDAGDVPTFEPLDRNLFPQSKPPCALWEAATRYLPRYLPLGPPAKDEANLASNADKSASLAAARALVERFRKDKARVIVLLHQARGELATRPEAGHEMLRVTCGQAGAKVHELGPAFQASIEGGLDPYRDDGLHPSAVGQQVIYQVLREAVLGAVESTSSTAAGESAN